MVKHNKKQRGKGGVGVAAAASAEAPPIQSAMVATTAVTAAPAPSSTVAFKNKEKVLVLSTRGITFRYRHLMTDLIALIPHSKKDSKLDTKTDRNVINEVADMKSCTSVVFFEVRKRMDLYLWFAKTPEGPSVKFHVANIHTMAEMKLSGNHLRGSRPVLSFHKAFEEQPHLQLIKELLTQVFATPKRHHKSKPFFDHVLAFSVADGRVWFRNYQVVVPVDKSKVDPESATLVEVRAAACTATYCRAPASARSAKPHKAHRQQQQQQQHDASSGVLVLNHRRVLHCCPAELCRHDLGQVGPRFCLNPIRIFDGAFGGRTLYENPMYVSPNAVRAAAKKAASGKYVSKVKAQQARKQHLGAHPMPRSDMEDLFMADGNEDDDE
ncbi:hypothetical protein QJQ45_015813 [Haematococcus lacustris]|nr:hypothetical protein QJQ45_015813 [Haematococcus lacustris]